MPRALAPLAAIRQLFASPLADFAMRRHMRRLLPEMEREVRAQQILAEQARAEVAATLPLLAPPQGKPYGYLDANAWRAYAEWMAAHDLISQAPPTDQVLTDELLP